jgi:hypothetical protein
LLVITRPQVGPATNPHDVRAQLGAEKFVRNALRSGMGKNKVEQQAYEALGPELAFRVVGGSTAMQISRSADDESLENAKHWYDRIVLPGKEACIDQLI